MTLLADFELPLIDSRLGLKMVGSFASWRALSGSARGHMLATISVASYTGDSFGESGLVRRARAVLKG